MQVYQFANILLTLLSFSGTALVQAVDFKCQCTGLLDNPSVNRNKATAKCCAGSPKGRMVKNGTDGFDVCISTMNKNKDMDDCCFVNAPTVQKGRYGGCDPPP